MESRAPGVQIREVELAPAAALDLSVAGFVGQAARGPLHSPQLLTSWGQYTDVFGGFVDYAYLPYVVYGYFANGGRRCWVVRTAETEAPGAVVTAARLDLLDRAGNPAVRVHALDPGAWGNAVEVDCRAGGRELALTRLGSDGAAANDTQATLASVAGLAVGDRLGLVHPGTSAREDVTLDAIDFAARQVEFSPPLTASFPAGSRVLGRGFRLTVRHRSGGRAPREEVFDDLVLDPAHERYFARVVNGDPPAESYAEKARRGQSTLVRVADPGGATARSRPVEIHGRTLAQGDDGALRLTLAHYTGYQDDVPFRPHGLPEGTLAGLAACERIAEIGGVAVPDLILPDLWAAVGGRPPRQGILAAELPPGADLPVLREGQRELLRHCRRMGERFALLDGPRGAEPGRGGPAIEDWANALGLLPEARDGALYYPWLRRRAADLGGRDVWLPPCGDVAGIYARSEEQRGVGKAPANEVLHGAVALEVCLDDARQAVLNPLGVNCLRALPGRGLRVWGARTLSREPLWRYVNVRRVALAIVKQILVRLRWTVFEPNDPLLWSAVTATLTLFLLQLLDSGALAGATPEEAFFVQCDEETNPPELIDRGQMVARVGFAPARPAEFVVVTIRRTAESLAVAELGS